MSSWHSYPKIWNFGHNAIIDIFMEPVSIEEKVDGSQFSFGVFDGLIKIRSKGQEMMIDAPEKMFSKAVNTVMNLHAEGKLVEGYTYRAEYLQKPKHNVLAYDRVPDGNLILFDVNTGEETYMSYAEKAAEAKRLGLEVVPLLFEGKITSVYDLTKLLETKSILGGQLIEGFIAKNYQRFGKDKKALMGKYVSEAFKEKHKVDWKDTNPKQGDIIQRLIDAYRTPARWDKAIIHAKENGLLNGEPKDLGVLIPEIKKDLTEECSEEIKQVLLDWAMSQVLRGTVLGFPEYYKELLLKKQFQKDVT